MNSILVGISVVGVKADKEHAEERLINELQRIGRSLGSL